ncbi:hypothetical protein M3J09_009728 [Ascochyta lentis]
MEVTKTMLTSEGFRMSTSRIWEVALRRCGCGRVARMLRLLHSMRLSMAN